MAVRVSLLSTTMLSGIVGGVFLTTMTAFADEMYTSSPSGSKPLAMQMPAVDGINGKIDGFGGSFASKGIAGAKGSLSVPIGGQFGLQIDGAAGTFDSKSFGAIAGHLFWRNPAQGLIGLYVNHTYWNQFGGARVSQAAVEGEYYWGQWSLQAIAGIEAGNNATYVTGTPAAGFLIQSYDVRSRFFDQVNLSYYLQDNWKAFVGHRYLGGKNALALGTEWGMPMSGGKMASLFVEGRAGEGNYRGIWGGLKLYFGQKDKPLVQRHRQDDPIDWSPESLFSIVNSYGLTTIPGVSPCPPGEILFDGFCIFPPD